MFPEKDTRCAIARHILQYILFRAIIVACSRERINFLTLGLRRGTKNTHEKDHLQQPHQMPHNSNYFNVYSKKN